MLTPRMVRAIVLGAFGFASLTAAAPARTAFFHAHLVKSDPAANDTLAAAPKAMRFWFSERVDLPVTRVKLVNASGVAMKLSAVTRSDTAVAAPVVVGVLGALGAGTYTVHWSTAAADGHPQKGEFVFVVKGH